MPEDLTNTLQQFTPTLPDRDALLFAAGRASARPAPIWKILCAVLTTSQIAMLAVWLARPVTTTEPLPRPLEHTGDDSPTPFTPDPYSYIALSRSADLDLPQLPSESNRPERPAPALNAGWRGELPN